jgi:hypothetical protein
MAVSMGVVAIGICIVEIAEPGRSPPLKNAFQAGFTDGARPNAFVDSFLGRSCLASKAFAHNRRAALGDAVHLKVVLGQVKADRG